MPETFDATAWSALLLGLYTLFTGIGALRNRQAYRAMLEELDRSPALQLITGLLELLLGAAIYLTNPWIPADIVTCIMKTVGGIMIVEALVLVAFCDIYAGFWLKNLAFMHRGWAVFTVVIGLGLTVAGFARFH